ncbi:MULTISPECIES: alpha/beta hydrolase [unclassified Streptomyces]|uniref:alpha/beta fold hydrolase n=1 Tax=unclassified Streptomyces TaxID=2593676 RepID=UPI002F91BDD5
MTVVRFHAIDVAGVQMFYREAGEPGAPKLVLLGGFPSSSHQWRDLLPALADRGFHVVSPDYPGFGYTEAPEDFTYTFDRVSEVVEQWLTQIGFTSFGLYHQDYGGPIGNRITGRHPEWLQWQVVQNSNAYEEGFTEVWDSIRFKLWQARTPETEAALLPFLQTDGVKSIYLSGHNDPALISPDNWTVDVAFLDRPGRRKIQLDLLEDYKTNPPLYETWQAFMREHQPKTIVFWGQGDVFFTPEGGDAYLRDLPEAEMHRLDSGHFAAEDHVDYIADNIARFHAEKVAPY